MSFYGHILYEFTKLFSKFNFTNQGVNVETLQADDAWEQLNFNTGDRWLKFSVSGEEPNERTVNLTHENPSEEIDQTLTYFDLLDAAPGGTINQLHGGDYVAINTKTTYDEKGHLNSTQDSVNYRLPKVVMTTTTEEPDADSDNDELWFTGDHWIKASVDESGEHISFSHNEPNNSEEEEKTPYEFKVNDNEPESDILHCGDSVHLLTEAQYDSKGHLIKLDSASYTLPTVEVQISGEKPGSQDTLWLEGDTWINLTGDAHDKALTFSHADPKTDGAADCSGLTLICEGATAVNDETRIKVGMPDASQAKYDEFVEKPSVHILEPGELIKIHSITKDAKGHIASNSEAYIKLPISADTAMFDSYVDRINILEGRLGEKDTEGSYEKNVETLSNLNTQSEDFASITDLTGSLEETMYTVKEEEDKYKNLTTITATIGQIDGENGYSKKIAELQGDSYDTVYTLSVALKHLAKKLIDMSATVSNLNKNVDDLYRKNSELEEQIKKLQPTTE